MTSYSGTNTYLIECSRENSKINLDDDKDTNGAWSNETSCRKDIQDQNIQQ